MKLSSFKLISFSLVFVALVVSFETGFAQTNCPEKTTPGLRTILFVGNVTSMGNDKKVQAWFEYGENKDNMRSTKKLILTKEGLYCLRINDVKPCQTYFYRAAVANEIGRSYGEIKTIKTLCSEQYLVSNPKNTKSNTRSKAVERKTAEVNRYKNYQILPISINLDSSYKFKKCSTSELSLTLVNNISLRRKVTIEVKGDAANWFSPQRREFMVKPKESRIINWSVEIPCKPEKNEYQVTFKVTTTGLSDIYSTTIELKQGEKSNPFSAFTSLIFSNFPWFLVFILLIIVSILIFLNLSLAINRKNKIELSSESIK